MSSTETDSRWSFDDVYATCHDTHATLCIYLPDGFDPSVVSETLGIQASRTQVRGEVLKGRLRHWPTAWFLRSEEQVQSKDLRRHIDWLLDQLVGKSEYIQDLQRAGADIHIGCFWVSAFGHGGPMLDRHILERLVALGLAIDFDIYFAGDDINDIFDKARSPKMRRSRWRDWWEQVRRKYL
jgi:hypothetical protein